MIALLFDHLWQCSIFAGGAALLTLALRRNSANARFWLWFVASVKFLVPFAALTAAGTYLLTPITRPLPAPTLMLMEPVVQPFSAPNPILTMPGLVTTPAATHLDMVSILLALWATGFAVVAARWLVRWSKLRGLMRTAVTMQIAAPVAVKSSSSRLEPGLVGIFRPIVVLPQGIEEQLSPSEFSAILAHELSHWRRRDNLFAAVHMVVEALFWFFPLVWWLGARLNAERERACDESVLAAGSDPKTYAEGILKVCRIYMQSPLACVAGVSGASLKKRIEAIMAECFSIPLSVTKKLTLAATAVAVIVVPVSLGSCVAPPAIVQAEASSPHPGTEVAVREQIAGWEKRQPVTDDMTQTMIDATHQQQASIQMMIDGLGPLQSVVFKGRNEGGGDVYLATFEHGALTWTIAPLIDGKISGVGFSPAIIRSDTGPSPGTEEALRQNIAGFSAGAPAYQIMMPGTANATRQQLTGLEDMAKALGPLKTLTFKNVNPRGWDDYHAVYENGEAEWTIQPLIDGKVSGILITNPILNNAEPHPDREASLRRYIESLEQGTPNYDEMAPALAATVRQQLPQTLGTIKSLGQLQSISFEHGSPIAGGADVYLVTFEHGKIEWTIGALTADGKAQQRGFRLL